MFSLSLVTSNDGDCGLISVLESVNSNIAIYNNSNDDDDDDDSSSSNDSNYHQICVLI